MTPKIIQQLAEFFSKKLDRVGVEIKGAELVTIKGIQGEKGDKGDKGDAGKDGSDGKDSNAVGPKGDNGSNGKDGKDGTPGVDGRDGVNGADGIRGKDGLKGKAGKDGSPDTGEQIIRKINEDPSDLLIRKGKVEGWDEIESRARTAEANTGMFLQFAGDTVRTYDLSASLDGVTKTFALPANARVLLVIASSFPNIFRPTMDYTSASGNITFTSQIDAATTLASGQSVVILYKIP